MIWKFSRAMVLWCSPLVLLVAVPTDASCRALPLLRSTAGIVIVPSPKGQPITASHQAQAAASRHLSLRERLRAWRDFRNLIRAVVDEGKAAKLAKRSLTFGIIAMSALLFTWLPVVGGILFLGVVPMGVLALVDGLRARKMGSDHYAGLVLGIVSISLFLLVIVIALLFLVGLLTLLG